MIFYLILVGIPSILALFLKKMGVGGGGGGWVCLTDKIRSVTKKLSTVPPNKWQSQCNSFFCTKKRSFEILRSKKIFFANARNLETSLPPCNMKQGNFDRWGNFDRLSSFVKGAMGQIQKCLFVASAFMEIND